MKSHKKSAQSHRDRNRQLSSQWSDLLTQVALFNLCCDKKWVRTAPSHQDDRLQ